MNKEKKLKLLIRKPINKILIVALLLVIPTILLVTSFDSIRTQEKNWYNSGYDPSYAYLFNSMNIATFKLVGHVDHPGTTIQVIGGVILKVAWNIHPYGGKDLKEAVAAEPEYYLRILNISTAALGSLIIFFGGLFLFNKSRNIWYAFLIQASPFISGVILLNAFVRISQESTLLISSIAMAALVLHWYMSEEDKHNKLRYIIGFAVITGFGLASKIIFAPIMIIPIMLLGGFRTKLKYLGLSIAAFIFFTLPILPMYPHMAKWVAGLFLHSGIYGSGDASIIDKSMYLISLKELLFAEPRYLFVYALSIIVLLFLVGKKLLTKNHKLKKETLLLTALFLAQTIGFIIVAKHPKDAYLLPYESLSAANLIVILHMVTKGISKQWIRQLITGIIVIPILALTMSTGIKAKELLFSGERNDINEKAWTVATKSGEGWATIGVNPGPSPIAALFFANAYSINRYGDKLTQLYPDYFILNTYDSRIENWHREVVPFDFIYKKYQGKVTIILDSFMIDDVQKILLKENNRLRFETEYPGPVTVLKPEIMQEGTLTSGTSIVTTNPDSPYAFTQIFYDIKPGTVFTASVRAKGDNEIAQIVASANNSAEFYSAATNKEKNLGEWYTITLNIHILKPLSDGQLKIYCWNSGKEPVYFDDFNTERTITELKDNR